MYKVGIIGCGRMGWIFSEDKLTDQPVSHAEAYIASGRVKITAVCDPDKRRLKGISGKYGIKDAYTDYRDMLRKAELDIVSITAPAALHRDACVAASEAGVRAIFCEKPIALSLKEADEVIKACRKNKTLLAVNHTRRWDRSFNKVKKLLDKGTIGKVDLIVAFAAAGLMNSGTHLFDLLRYYFGDVRSISGSIVPDGSCDPGGKGRILFENGLSAFFDSSFRDYLLFGAALYGRKGMLELTSGIRTKEAYNLFLAEKGQKAGGIKELKKVAQKSLKPPPPMVNAVENIVNALDGKEALLCDGRDGAAALEIALAFHESSKKGGAEVSFPLKNRSLKVAPRQTSFTKDGRL